MRRIRALGALIRDLRHAERGQVLPIFAVMSVVLLGAAALVTDVAWMWTNQQRMQRAADAGALAGAIFLPGNEAAAFSTARAETAKNGFTNGSGGVVVTPRRDPGDPRKLLVDIDAPVGTFFAKVFCFDGSACLTSADVGVTGAATYVLPVPMGSPQNYYGVGYLVDAVTTTETEAVADETPYHDAGASGTGDWSGANNALTNNNNYATEGNNGDQQVWRDFGLQAAIPDANTTIDAIEVGLTDVFINSSSSGCEVRAALSWDGGSSWSSNVGSGSLSTSTTSDRNLGWDGSGTTAPWGSHPWTRDELSDANFRVRLTWSCSTGRTVSLDLLEVHVHYTSDVTTTTTSIEQVDVESPEGDVLAPQNFWGALQSQGAPNIQGDAYMTWYDTRTSTANPQYDAANYYQYAIEFPAGTSNGEVWVFDPGFCETGTARGTGEYWAVGGANGYGSRQPISTYYRLYDTNNTPYDVSDDTQAGTSGSSYRRLFFSDHDLGQTNADDCSAETWHNDWWQIGIGLQGGRTYRLHTFSLDPDNPDDQLNSTALNAFAIWSKATGGTPKVYGLGAMEAYVRLPGGRSSEFYLAQIDAEHAGKVMVIQLWDPGDTGSLAADLQILEPGATDYVVTPFSYTAKKNSGAASDCNSRQGSNVTSVTTNTGGTSLFNGCWITIEIPLPASYSAPLPSNDTFASEGGWWKIRYNMTGSTSSNSTDLTTWQVSLRGSPVHLVLE
jgi:Flp pilus assembly protein TadG